MKCPNPEYLLAYVANELNNELKEEIEIHLNQCGICSSKINVYRKTVEFWGEYEEHLNVVEKEEIKIPASCIIDELGNHLKGDCCKRFLLRIYAAFTIIRAGIQESLVFSKLKGALKTIPHPEYAFEIAFVGILLLLLPVLLLFISINSKVHNIPPLTHETHVREVSGGDAEDHSEDYAGKGFGGSVSVLDSLIVCSEPTEFTWTPEPQNEGAPAQFADTSTSPLSVIDSWSWDFGDGDTSSEQNPSHIYADNGTYTVTLTVTDEYGLTDTVSHSATNDSPKTEGTAITVTVSQIDPGILDTFTYSFDWDNDGIYEIVDQTSPSASHTWSDEGIYTVGVMVKDDDGGIGIATTEVMLMSFDYIVSYEWDLDNDDIRGYFTADPVYILLSAADCQPLFGSPNTFDINLRITDTLSEIGIYNVACASDSKIIPGLDVMSSATFTGEPIPEPTTIILMSLGLLGFIGIAIRKNRKNKRGK